MVEEYICCFLDFRSVLLTGICIVKFFILFVLLHNKFNIRITYYNNYIMYTKEKIIQKDRKITRNQKKKQQVLRFNQPELQKAFKNFHKGNKSLYLDRKLRKNQERAVEDQNIVVNLNLGQYGFDSSIKLLNNQKIEDIITKTQIFSVNPNIEGLEWKQLCCQLTDRFQSQNYLIHYKNMYSIYDGKSSKMIEISKEEYNLYDCLHQLFTKIKNGCKSPGLFGVISSETETARKILLNSKNNVTQLQYIERWKQIQIYKQQYLKQLAFKTFTYGLRELVIDELNYFLQKQFQQNSRNIRNAKIQVRIKNWQEWAEFIQKKRVRLRKANKFLLHTACQLCLSVYSELQNPIVNCNQCHIRGHKLCLDPNKQNRCGRCIYLRLSNEMKQKIPECFLCSVKNLVPLRINSSKFVHVFCIMAHGMWQLTNFKIVMSSKAQTESIQKEKKNRVCKFCYKQSEYYTKCENCNSTCHYLCAYISGAHFQVTQQRQIKVYCCQESEQILQKQGYQRKYILNYNNLVFKKLNQVQNMLKNTKKHRANEQQYMQNQFEMNLNNENILMRNFYEENEIEDNYYQEQRGGFSSS